MRREWRTGRKGEERRRGRGKEKREGREKKRGKNEGEEKRRRKKKKKKERTENIYNIYIFNTTNPNESVAKNEGRIEEAGGKARTRLWRKEGG